MLGRVTHAPSFPRAMSAGALQLVLAYVRCRWMQFIWCGTEAWAASLARRDAFADDNNSRTAVFARSSIWKCSSKRERSIQTIDPRVVPMVGKELPNHSLFPKRVLLEIKARITQPSSLYCWPRMSRSLYSLVEIVNSSRMNLNQDVVLPQRIELPCQSDSRLFQATFVLPTRSSSLAHSFHCDFWRSALHRSFSWYMLRKHHDASDENRGHNKYRWRVRQLSIKPRKRIQNWTQQVCKENREIGKRWWLESKAVT